MIETLLSILAHWVIVVIETTGYAGIVLLSAAESANIPIPSEVIVPFSGFLAFEGAFTFWGVVAAATVGNVLGSVVSYWMAGWLIRYRHKFFIHILISDRMLEKARKFFDRYGAASVFFSRLMPVVRTFISLPAGLGKMNMTKFIAYTAAGSFLWSLLLTWVGWLLGANWHDIGIYFRTFDYGIVAIIVAGGIWWAMTHLRGVVWDKQSSKTNDTTQQ